MVGVPLLGIFLFCRLARTRYGGLFVVFVCSMLPYVLPYRSDLASSNPCLIQEAVSRSHGDFGYLVVHTSNIRSQQLVHQYFGEAILTVMQAPRYIRWITCFVLFAMLVLAMVVIYSSISHHTNSEEPCCCKCNSDSATTPATIRPKLTKEGYFTMPSVENMKVEDNRCIVDNLVIGKKDAGYVLFPGKTDVTGLDLDELGKGDILG